MGGHTKNLNCGLLKWNGNEFHDCCSYIMLIKGKKWLDGLYRIINASTAYVRTGAQSVSKPVPRDISSRNQTFECEKRKVCWKNSEVEFTTISRLILNQELWPLAIWRSAIAGSRSNLQILLRLCRSNVLWCSVLPDVDVVGYQKHGWKKRPIMPWHHSKGETQNRAWSTNYTAEQYLLLYTVLYGTVRSTRTYYMTHAALSSSRSISRVDSYQNDRWEPSHSHASQASIETDQTRELKWIHDAFGNFCTNFAEIALSNRSTNNPFETSLYRGRCTIAEVFLRFEDRTIAIRSLFSDSLWWPRG